jgi:hypothetical protein
MLGPAFAGEGDAAVLAAHRFVRERGLTWQEVLRPPNGPQRSAYVTWRDVVGTCLRYPGDLSPWGVHFLRGLRRFPRLSPKQAACVTRFADRMLG